MAFEGSQREQVNRMQIYCLKFRDLQVTDREACSGKLLAYIFCLTLKQEEMEGEFDWFLSV